MVWWSSVGKGKHSKILWLNLSVLMGFCVWVVTLTSGFSGGIAFFFPYLRQEVYGRWTWRKEKLFSHWNKALIKHFYPGEFFCNGECSRHILQWLIFSHCQSYEGIFEDLVNFLKIKSTNLWKPPKTIAPGVSHS